MKSAKFSHANFCKFIGIQSANMVEGVTTCLCSIVAFGSLFVLEGWGMKLAGFISFLVLAYLVAWMIDVLKGEA